MQLTQNKHSNSFLIAEISAFRKISRPLSDADRSLTAARVFAPHSALATRHRISNRQSYEKLEPYISLMKSVKLTLLIDTKMHFIQGVLSSFGTVERAPAHKCLSPASEQYETLLRIIIGPLFERGDTA